MAFASIKCSLWADINGTTVDLAKVACSFEKDRIPQAVLQLPVGRQVRTLDLASSHELSRDISVQLPAKVYANIGLVASDTGTAIVPNGQYTLFDGYMTGLGYSQQHNGLAMTIGLTHWLSDLTYSSTLSGTSHPDNPAQYIFNASLQAAGDAAGAGASKGHFFSKTQTQASMDTATLSQDLWGKAILPWFLDLAASDRISFEQLGKNDGDNKEAKKALERFDGMKLPLDTADADIQAISAAICNDIAVSSQKSAMNSYAAMAHTTFWDKLVGQLGPLYMFSVIPFPEKAMVVPFVPGLREHWAPGGGFTINARDVSAINLNPTLPRTLRAVAIHSQQGNLAGANLGPVGMAVQSVGGIYEGAKTGLVMFKNAPKWLSYAVSPSNYGRDASGAAGKVRGTATSPRAGEDSEKTKPKDIIAKLPSLMDKFAQTLYAYELLKTRTGELAGVLRFDICPGSTIKIEGTAGAFTAGGDPMGEPRYASVIRTSIQFDAQSNSVGTSFNLAHVRTEEENDADNTSIEAHPLYTTTWPGEELIS